VVYFTVLVQIYAVRVAHPHRILLIAVRIADAKDNASRITYAVVRGAGYGLYRNRQKK